MDYHCHGNGNENEGVALDEEVETKLSNSTSELLQNHRDIATPTPFS